jgi:type II secretory pathway pseudopilin PulG
VIAIIAILMALLLPVLFRAYTRVKDMADEQEAPEVAHLLRKEARRYCSAIPRFRFDSKADFEEKCDFVPKCRAWIEKSATEFVPFDYLTATNKIVLSVHIGRRHATTYSFSKEDLSVRPER